MKKSIETLVMEWFKIWTKGNIESLPLSEDFVHISPYGTIESKAAYMDIVNQNREMFLNNRFEIHDEIYESDKVCIRYTMISQTVTLDVSEWIYTNGNLISKIVAYYNFQQERDAGRGIEVY